MAREHVYRLWEKSCALFLTVLLQADFLTVAELPPRDISDLTTKVHLWFHAQRIKFLCMIYELENAMTESWQTIMSFY